MRRCPRRWTIACGSRVSTARSSRARVLAALGVAPEPEQVFGARLDTARSLWRCPRPRRRPGSERQRLERRVRQDPRVLAAAAAPVRHRAGDRRPASAASGRPASRVIARPPAIGDAQNTRSISARLSRRPSCQTGAWDERRQLARSRCDIVGVERPAVRAVSPSIDARRSAGRAVRAAPAIRARRCRTRWPRARCPRARPAQPGTPSAESARSSSGSQKSSSRRRRIACTG